MSNTGGQDVAPAAAPAVDGNADQQQQGFTFSGIVKGLLIRAVFIYFITSLFRRPQPQQVNPDGNAPKPAANIFSNGTAMVCIKRDINRLRALGLAYGFSKCRFFFYA